MLKPREKRALEIGLTESDLKLPRIHITDSMSFRDCRWRWNVTSMMRNGLEKAVPPRALWFGTGIHIALERFYADGENPVEAFEDWARESLDKIEADFPGAEVKDLEDHLELGTGMMRYYQDWSAVHDDFDFIVAEESFLIKPDKRIWPVEALIEGTGDGVIRDKKTGLYWVLEHKTAITIETDRLLLEEQPGVYQYAMQQHLGVPIQGVRYNFLRKKLPSVPKLLAKGDALSRAQIDSTPEVYRGAIRQHGLQEKDYADKLKTLEAHVKNKPFFYREDVVRSDENLDMLIWELSQVADAMVSDPVIYSSPSPFRCQMCPVMGACIAYHDQKDYQFILKSQYRKRTDQRGSEKETKSPAGNKLDLLL